MTDPADELTTVPEHRASDPLLIPSAWGATGYP